MACDDLESKRRQHAEKVEAIAAFHKPERWTTTPLSHLVFADRDTLDFNIKRAGPHRHTEENAGWRILGEVALVNFVECLEALRAYTEYVHFQDVLEVGSGRLKCRL